MRTLIAGGGTGGHLTPALAVAEELRRSDPDGSVVLVTRRGGVARELVEGTGIPVEEIDVSGVDVSSPRTVAAALGRMPLAVRAADRAIRRLRPDVVVGAAGYVCVPVALAAAARRIPVVLLEQNAVPGRAVRMLSRLSAVVCASYTETVARLPHARVVTTGNPVRRAVSENAPAPARDRCERILVTGGSQGARRLNTAVTGCVRALLDDDPRLVVVHQCGRADAETVGAAAAALPEALRARYVVRPFFDDLAAEIRAADLVVMRAGGSSLAEVTVIGRPMVVVPYPHAGAHQRHNVAPYAERGAAIVIDDAECTPERLRSELESLLRDGARLRRMTAASAAAGRPDAAARVAELLRSVAAEHTAAGVRAAS